MPRCSPGGSKIAFVSQTPEQPGDTICGIYVMDADGFHRTQLTHPGLSFTCCPAWLRAR